METTENNKCAEDFLCKYLKFKENCVNAQLFDIEEIIKLFEVWLNSL